MILEFQEDYIHILSNFSLNSISSALCTQSLKACQDIQIIIHITGLVGEQAYCVYSKAVCSAAVCGMVYSVYYSGIGNMNVHLCMKELAVGFRVDIHLGIHIFGLGKRPIHVELMHNN